jgi:cellobiose epimerase
MKKKFAGRISSSFPLFLLCATTFAVIAQKSVAQSMQGNIQTNMDTIRAEMQNVLKDELKRWYPSTMDTVYGGFFSDLNYEWQLEGPQNKMIVTQARHVWAASNAAMFYRTDSLLRFAAHGVAFLRDVMWDSTYGGFYDLVTREGKPITQRGTTIKTAYGNAFAIYGLAAYYDASGDTAALHMAQQTFAWMEQHSYDSVYGGYFQFISRDGTPFVDGYGPIPPKDYNSMIHIFEAYTELYKVWKNQILHDRLYAMLTTIRDTFITPQGYLRLYFKRDWTHVSYRDSSAEVREKNYELDHITFGHDVETSYLMLEASNILGIKNDTTTLTAAKKMVDYAIANGWDKEHGGLYDGGYDYENGQPVVILRRTKEWWSEVEAFNAFLLMYDLFPQESEYYQKFCEQWNYCKNYLIDFEHGGWYWGGTDIVPRNKTYVKGSIWKGDYHTSRGLINCIRRITEMEHDKTMH